MSATKLLSYPEGFNDVYRLLHKIGEGSHSTVWAAVDLTRMEVVAMKMIFGEDWEGLIAEEVANNALLEISIGHQTQCFPKNFDHGFIDAAILEVYPEIMSEEAYASKEAGISGYEDVNVAYLTMPLYADNISDMDLNPSFLFEIILTLVAAHNVGLYHGDLYPRNIMIQKVFHKRKYTVQEHIFIIENEYMPIIIDWINPGGDIHTVASDLENIPTFLTVDPKIKHALYQNDSDVLLSPYFGSLQYGHIESTDCVKYFEPLF